MRYSRPRICNVWGKNRLFKSGKAIRLRWDFCWSRIWKKCRILVGAGAKIRYRPTTDCRLSPCMTLMTGVPVSAVTETTVWRWLPYHCTSSQGTSALSSSWLTNTVSWSTFCQTWRCDGWYSSMLIVALTLRQYLCMVNLVSVVCHCHMMKRRLLLNDISGCTVKNISWCLSCILLPSVQYNSKQAASLLEFHKFKWHCTNNCSGGITTVSVCYWLDHAEFQRFLLESKSQLHLAHATECGMSSSSSSCFVSNNA